MPLIGSREQKGGVERGQRAVTPWLASLLVEELPLVLVERLLPHDPPYEHHMFSLLFYILTNTCTGTGPPRPCAPVPSVTHWPPLAFTLVPVLSGPTCSQGGR